MTRHGMHSPLPQKGVVCEFINRVQNGINQALSFPGPSMVIAHGGVHWAICSLMGIKEHEWMINNCVPIHFSIDDGNHWIARKLITRNSGY